jgi:hypothetical protein
MLLLKAVCKRGHTFGSRRPDDQGRRLNAGSKVITAMDFTLGEAGLQSQENGC